MFRLLYRIKKVDRDARAIFQSQILPAKLCGDFRMNRRRDIELQHYRNTFAAEKRNCSDECLEKEGRNGDKRTGIDDVLSALPERRALVYDIRF